MPRFDLEKFAGHVQKHGPGKAVAHVVWSLLSGHVRQYNDAHKRANEKKTNPTIIDAEIVK